MTRTFAQTSGVSSFPKEGTAIHPRLVALARKLWPSKTAANIAARTGKTERAAKKFLSGLTGLSAESLEALLRSDVGLLVLTEIMNAAEQPEWWPEFRDAVEIVRLQQRIDRLQADVARLSSVDREEVRRRG